MFVVFIIDYIKNFVSEVLETLKYVFEHLKIKCYV
jgi:hypothetical protein